MREADVEEAEEGVRIGGRKLNNLRYADDMTLLAEKEEDMKTLMERCELPAKSQAKGNVKQR